MGATGWHTKQDGGEGRGEDEAARFDRMEREDERDSAPAGQGSWPPAAMEPLPATARPQPHRALGRRRADPSLQHAHQTVARGSRPFRLAVSPCRPRPLSSSRTKKDALTRLSGSAAPQALMQGHTLPPRKAPYWAGGACRADLASACVARYDCGAGRGPSPSLPPRSICRRNTLPS